MPNLKMPVVAGTESNFPSKAALPMVSKNKVLEPHSFAT